MTAKKSDPEPTGDDAAGAGNAKETIEARRKAKEEAVNQTGVDPPAPVDINEPQDKS